MLKAGQFPPWQKFSTVMNIRCARKLERWQTRGLGGLWEAPGRGAKRQWQEADMQHLEKCLEEEQRTYNSHQLSVKLEQDRQVKLSPDRIRRVLQKRGGDGSAPATRNITSKTQTGDNSNKSTSKR